MTLYQAPVEDLSFILQHHLGADDLTALKAFSTLDDDLVKAILNEAGRFAEQVLAPLNQPGDLSGCRYDDGQVATPPGWKEAYGRFRDAGWIGLGLPDDLGGQGLPKVLSMPIGEFWQGANLAFSMIQPLTDGGVSALLASGNDALIAQYGADLVSGEWTATMALTEPAAGSDLGLIQTRAEPDKKGRYLISGQKLYISYGQHDLSDRIVHLVLARLPNAPTGSKGISLFAVPSHREDGTLNGVRCTGIEQKMGLHGSPTCALDFSAAEADLVGVPNQGLRIMFVMMNETRLSVGLQGVAVAERAYQNALVWAGERHQGKPVAGGDGPVPLLAHPDIKRLLLRSRSHILAARLLGATLALRLDQVHQNDPSNRSQAQQELDLLTPVFKAWSTETACQLTADVIQIYGGMGFIEETGVAQFHRDLKVSTIYEGTTGIQAQDFIGRKVMRDQGAALFAWLNRVDSSMQPLQGLSHCAAEGSAIAQQVAELRETVQWLLETQAQNPAYLQAASVALLEATGIVAGAWQLAQAVVKAEADAVSPHYRDNLAALLSFYCGHWLALVPAHLMRAKQAEAGLAAYRFDY